MTHLIDWIEAHSALFTALAGMAGLLGTLIGWFFQYQRMKRQRNELQTKVDHLHRQLQEQTGQLATVAERLNQAEVDKTNLTGDKARLNQALKDEQQQHETVTIELTQKLEDKSEEVGGREKEIKRIRYLINRMMKLEGKLWENPARTRAPKFRPLQERQMPIISVLNLKGGVGKTTLTAHLAAAFSAKGYRALLIDFDLQGTLSSFFLSYQEIVDRFKEERLLQHFLNQATYRRGINLLDYVHPIFEDGRSAIIPTSDKLAYAEMNLTMSWLLGLCKRDTRFLLRTALHLKRIEKAYDIVLLDCPPHINTCCVNALAASDYVLIPVNPSKKVTERIPLLLNHVKKLSMRINPHLEVAGIVMNRSYQSDKLTTNEDDLWKEALGWGHDLLGLPLHGFKTLIPQTTKIRDNEVQNFKGPEPGSDLFKTFAKLATEIENRMPSECRRTPATTS